MHGVKFEGATFDLVKPANMKDEECYSLPATVGVDTNGFPFILTAFMPNIDDLKALQEGRPLFLKVIGTTFAPVALYTLDENGNINIDQ